MGEKTIFDFFQSKKLNYSIILLVFFLFMGFYLRFYHVDYPVIGYHNWKSAHYLTEARNFADEGFFKAGFFVPLRDTMNQINEQPNGAHADTFPLDPIIIGFLFKFFGPSLKLARFVEILFSMGSILAFYLLIKELFNREILALMCAFLAAINPLFVFFTHNIQVVNSALFFMILGSYFYAKWLKNIKKSKLLVFAALFIAISAMTKYTFVVILLPILFSFPYKKIFKNPQKYYSVFVIVLLVASIFPAWFLYSEKIIKPKLVGHLIDQGQTKYELSSLIDFSIIADKQFWLTMKSYVADNFTLRGMSFAIFGLAVFLAFFWKNLDKEGYKFMMGYFVGSIMFLFVMGFKLSGHNYHQFPIAPFILFMIAFLVEFISENINQFVKVKTLHVIVFFTIAILFAGLLWGPSKDSRDRMYNTQFPGLDIAGNYINIHKEDTDRVMHSSGQSFGFLWNANMPGYKGPGKLENLQKAETEFNVNWLFVYQWGIQNYLQDPIILEHIKQNYRLVQFGYRLNDNQAVPIFFVFRKGGTFDDQKINDLLAGKPIHKTQYWFTSGPYEIYHVDIE